MDKAKRYSNINLALSLTGTILGWVFLGAIVFFGFTKIVEQWSFSVTSSSYLALLVFAGILGVIETILFFPLSFYSGYLLEHKYELSNLNLKTYFWEKVKALLVGIIIGVPVLLVFYYLLNTYQNWWWLPVGIFMFVVSVILGRLAPTLIFPIFYKFDPIEDESLVSLISKRCQSVGMKVTGVFQFNLSKTTKKANAAFTGIGKSKRVIIGDTLIDNFNQEEIDAILSHELGHFKLKHLWKMMALGTTVTFIGLYVVSLVYLKSVSVWDFDGITQLAALPLLALLLGVYGFLVGPIQNAVSRHYEYAADRFSLDLAGYKGSMISSLEKLADQNLADRDPHSIVEFLFHSHPSIKHRVTRLKAYNF